MSNFFEMGSSHIQPAWESNNNNKKKVEGVWGEARRAAVSLGPEPPVRGARAGARGSGGRCGAGGRAVRGRAVPAASSAGEPGPGGGDAAGAGPAAPPLPVWPSTCLRPPARAPGAPGSPRGRLREVRVRRCPRPAPPAGPGGRAASLRARRRAGARRGGAGNAEVSRPGVCVGGVRTGHAAKVRPWTRRPVRWRGRCVWGGREAPSAAERGGQS